ncbi:ABC transporter permease [Clostridium omnivorum]|uniref:Peptide ABC transporter permease n=1 Tax=Clostridium omnivorum TaxID=1604902 RepID=A0ABQ5N0J6_9CLOT|nr:ABC transporter permease [Clostridium sp. E14]GLC28725.1 peptide ABC transporter permease [Clostridium sp. E14]
MLKYILKRLGASLITLWVVVTVTFILSHAIPGGPFDREKPLPPEVKKNIEERYNLNKPIWWQYGDYIKNLAKLDLGPSFQQRGVSVNDIINRGFPVSARLGTVAIILALTIGLVLGIIAALRQGKWQDNATMLLSTLGVTIPSFVIATLFIYVFAEKLRWFPVFGLTSPRHYVLPAIALSGFSMAFISRIVRSSLLDVVRQDYIRTAKSKGLSEGSVILRHALKNAILPVVTYLGPLVAGVLTGSFVIERVFTIPGLGRFFVDSIGNRDYTAILGVTVFYSLFLVICNLVVDILYALVDPRIKLEG